MRFTADILMAIASVFFASSVIPQIKKVYQLKSAKGLSWAFLIATSIALILFITGKVLVRCYVAGMVDLLSLGGYLTLVFQKKYYQSR